MIIIISLGVIILSGIITLIIVMKKGNKKPMKLPIQEAKMKKDPLEGMNKEETYVLTNINENKIKNYIKASKSQGASDQNIKSALIKAGWREEDINKFL